MENLIPLIPGLLGIDTATFYATLGVIITIANLIGRIIPDSATGPLGIVRQVAKVLGLYVGNRISPLVSANDVARAVVATLPDSAILGSAGELKAAVAVGQPIGELAGSVTDSVLDAIAGRTPGRPFDPTDGSPAQDSIVPNEYRTDPFKAGAAAGFVEPTKGK